MARCDWLQGYEAFFIICLHVFQFTSIFIGTQNAHLKFEVVILVLSSKQKKNFSIYFLAKEGTD